VVVNHGEVGAQVDVVVDISAAGNGGPTTIVPINKTIAGRSVIIQVLQAAI